MTYPYIATMGEVVGIPGSYGNTFFIKVVWQFPELESVPVEFDYTDVRYEIQRETSPGVFGITLGTVSGWDNVFYDVASTLNDYSATTIKSNTEYVYRIRCKNRDGTYAEDGDIPVSEPVKSPSFPTYGVIDDQGSGDSWYAYCGLGVSESEGNPGRPTITVVGNNAFPTTGSGYDILVQMSEGGKAWTTVIVAVPGDHVALRQSDARLPANAFTGPGWIFVVEPPSNVLKYGTQYKVRLARKNTSTGLIENYSNAVNITTYSLDEGSFPNMWPNAGLQYGFYDDNQVETAGAQVPQEQNGATGTYERYFSAGAYPDVDSDSLGSIYSSPVISNTGTESLFYSGKAMRLQVQKEYFNGDNHASVINLSAYNFPLNPFGSLRYFGVVCRAMEDRYNYTVVTTSEDGNVVSSDSDRSFGASVTRIGQRRTLANVRPARFGMRLTYSYGSGSLMFRIRKADGSDTVLLERTFLNDVTTISGHANYYYVDIPYEESLLINEEVRLSVESNGACGLTTYCLTDNKPSEAMSIYNAGWSEIGYDLNYYFSYYTGANPNLYRNELCRLGVEGTDGLYFSTFGIISSSPDEREDDELDTIATGGYAKLLSGTYGLGPNSQQIVCPCTASTYVDSGFPTNNYGGAYNYEMSASYHWYATETRRMYLKFDLSGIPAGVEIISSYISLYDTYGYSNSTGEVKHPTTDWVESVITWDNKPASYHSETATFPFSLTEGRYNTTGNLNDTVQAYVENPSINYGWIIQTDEVTTSSGGQYGTRRQADDGHPDRVPYLVVTYTSPSANLYQSRMKLYAKSENYDMAMDDVFCNVYAGDFMMFDLTYTFGGNGIDIYDNSSKITALMVKNIVKYSSANWWDFNYEQTADPIPFDIVASATGEEININELHNVYDDLGGMDITGCLPMKGYALQYKKMGTSYYEEKTLEIDYQIPFSNVTLGSELLVPNTTYQIRYLYTNSGGEVGYSDPTYATTEPLPYKVSNVQMLRYYWAGQGHFYISWDNATSSDSYPVIGYYVELSEEDGSWTQYTVVGDLHTEVSVSYNKVYFCRVRAYNSLGIGEYSDIISSVSVSLPTKPQNPSYYFTDITGDTTKVIFSWEAPEDDGCSADGDSYFMQYVIMHGTDANNLSTNLVGPYEFMFQPSYSLNLGDSVYFKVGVSTNYTYSLYGTYIPGPFTDLKKVTFMTYTETVKVRGTARTEGYIDFYFTARTGDGSYVQLTGTDGAEAFWRLTDNTAPISVGANIASIAALIEDENLNPGRNIFKNGITNPLTDGYAPGWPLATDGIGPIYSVAVEEANDLFGSSIRIVFTMQQYDEYEWDVHTSMAATADSETSLGLDGMGSFLVITDYTTDISLYRTNTNVVDSTKGDFMSGTSGSLIWTVNSSVVYNPYLNQNENTPLTSKEFQIQVDDLDTFDDIALKIADPSTGLQAQLNAYFLGTEIDPAIMQLYYDADETTPFIVATEVVYMTDDKYHLKVNIKTTVEGIQNQVTCRTSNMYAFYLATRANTYYLNDMMYELRSYEDMYGRQKPGSTPVYGYTKRSYGFKFNLDYIREYSEDENASIDVTPIPGASSSTAIGLDVMGTTRTVSISGVRVDNSNYWMFHAPFEYIDDPATGGTGQVMQGGVIYLGTSNWGWCKFLKATMGTFQFIDGPYRLIIMTIPSSLMQQYVPDRHCKYQYPDGTYIIQAGIEDMCYVMIERFTTRKNDEMFNAIEYDLVLRRTVPLGSTP